MRLGRGLGVARVGGARERRQGQAIERDPDYGPALALAGPYHQGIEVDGWSENPEATRRTGIRALCLDGARSGHRAGCLLGGSAEGVDDGDAFDLPTVGHVVV